jgi:hypothetical protein
MEAAFELWFQKYNLQQSFFQHRDMLQYIE